MKSKLLEELEEILNDEDKLVDFLEEIDEDRQEQFLQMIMDIQIFLRRKGYTE